MRVAVCTIVYNEEAFIGGVIKNWKGKVEKHLILSSTRPWHGMSIPDDKTNKIARKLDVELITLPWASERSQRNWGLGYLYDYDYVLVVDADELYEEQDQFKILEILGTNAGEFRVDNTNCYRIPQVVTYFKTPEYILDPPDSHEPLIAINPKKATFQECRIPSQQYIVPIPSVKMHHLTFLRDDLRLWHKLHQFEHYNDVKPGWFENTWKHWTPDTENVRERGVVASKAVPATMPKEIRDLLEESIALTRE